MKTLGSLPRILATTLPKSGTHLLDAILSRMPGLSRLQHACLNTNLRYHPFNLFPGERCVVGIGRPVMVNMMSVRSALSRIRPGKYALGYIPYQPVLATEFFRRDLKVIALLRDPRDVCISAMYHSLHKRNHFMHKAMNALPDEKSRLKLILLGMGGTRRETGVSLRQQVAMISAWLEDSWVLGVRFEDLIGPKGGGNQSCQIESIGRIGRYLGSNLSRTELEDIGQEMFGKGRTFRRGQIGGWQELFDDELAELFEEELGTIIKELGYPPTII